MSVIACGLAIVRHEKEVPTYSMIPVQSTALLLVLQIDHFCHKSKELAQVNQHEILHHLEANAKKVNFYES